MEVRFGELAKIELSETRAYLELQQAGLGRRFNQDVREAVARISTVNQITGLIASRTHDFVSANR